MPLYGSMVRPLRAWGSTHGYHILMATNIVVRLVSINAALPFILKIVFNFKGGPLNYDIIANIQESNHDHSIQ